MTGGIRKNNKNHRSIEKPVQNLTKNEIKKKIKDFLASDGSDIAADPRKLNQTIKKVLLKFQENPVQHKIATKILIDTLKRNDSDAAKETVQQMINEAQEALDRLYVSQINWNQETFSNFSQIIQANSLAKRIEIQNDVPIQVNSNKTIKEVLALELDIEESELNNYLPTFSETSRAAESALPSSTASTVSHELGFDSSSSVGSAAPIVSTVSTVSAAVSVVSAEAESDSSSLTGSAAPIVSTVSIAHAVSHDLEHVLPVLMVETLEQQIAEASVNTLKGLHRLLNEAEIPTIKRTLESCFKDAKVRVIDTKDALDEKYSGYIQLSESEVGISSEVKKHDHLILLVDISQFEARDLASLNSNEIMQSLKTGEELDSSEIQAKKVFIIPVNYKNENLGPDLVRRISEWLERQEKELAVLLEHRITEDHAEPELDAAPDLFQSIDCEFKDMAVVGHKIGLGSRGLEFRESQLRAILKKHPDKAVIQLKISHCSEDKRREIETEIETLNKFGRLSTDICYKDDADKGDILLADGQRVDVIFVEHTKPLELKVARGVPSGTRTIISLETYHKYVDAYQVREGKLVAQAPLEGPIYVDGELSSDQWAQLGDIASKNGLDLYVDEKPGNLPLNSVCIDSDIAVTDREAFFVAHESELALNKLGGGAGKEDEVLCYQFSVSDGDSLEELVSKFEVDKDLTEGVKVNFELLGPVQALFDKTREVVWEFRGMSDALKIALITLKADQPYLMIHGARIDACNLKIRVILDDEPSFRLDDNQKNYLMADIMSKSSIYFQEDRLKSFIDLLEKEFFIHTGLRVQEIRQVVAAISARKNLEEQHYYEKQSEFSPRILLRAIIKSCCSQFKGDQKLYIQKVNAVKRGLTDIFGLEDSLDFRPITLHEYDDEENRKKAEAFLFDHALKFDTEADFLEARNFILTSSNDNNASKYFGLKTEFDRLSQENKEQRRLAKKSKSAVPILEKQKILTFIGETGAGKTYQAIEVAENLHKKHQINTRPIVIQAEATMSEYDVKERLFNNGWLQNGGVLIVDEANLAAESFKFLKAVLESAGSLTVKGTGFHLNNHYVIFTGNPAGLYGQREELSLGLKAYKRPVLQFKHAIIGKILDKVMPNQDRYNKAQNIAEILDLFNELSRCKQKSEDDVFLSIRDIQAIVSRAQRYMNSPVTLFKAACLRSIRDLYNDQLHLEPLLRANQDLLINDSIDAEFEEFFKALRKFAETQGKIIVGSDKACVKELYYCLTEGEFSAKLNIESLAKNGLFITGEAGRGKDVLVNLVCECLHKESFIVEQVTIAKVEEMLTQAKEALKEGKVVVIPEFNLLPTGLREGFNDLYTSKGYFKTDSFVIETEINEAKSRDIYNLLHENGYISANGELLKREKLDEVLAKDAELTDKQKTMIMCLIKKRRSTIIATQNPVETFKGRSAASLAMTSRNVSITLPPRSEVEEAIIIRAMIKDPDKANLVLLFNRVMTGLCKKKNQTVAVKCMIDAASSIQNDEIDVHTALQKSYHYYLEAVVGPDMDTAYTFLKGLIDKEILVLKTTKKAIKIQAQLRRYLEKDTIKTMKTIKIEEESARKIQAQYRKLVALREFNKSKAATEIQKIVRARQNKNLITEMKQQKAKDKAAIKIQAQYRKIIALREFNKLKEATKIQNDLYKQVKAGLLKRYFEDLKKAEKSKEAVYFWEHNFEKIYKALDAYISKRKANTEVVSEASKNLKVAMSLCLHYLVSHVTADEKMLRLLQNILTLFNTKKDYLTFLIKEACEQNSVHKTKLLQIFRQIPGIESLQYVNSFLKALENPQVQMPITSDKPLGGGTKAVDSSASGTKAVGGGGGGAKKEARPVTASFSPSKGTILGGGGAGDGQPIKLIERHFFDPKNVNHSMIAIQTKNCDKCICEYRDHGERNIWVKPVVVDNSENYVTETGNINGFEIKQGELSFLPSITGHDQLLSINLDASFGDIVEIDGRHAVVGKKSAVCDLRFEVLVDREERFHLSDHQLREKLSNMNTRFEFKEFEYNLSFLINKVKITSKDKSRFLQLMKEKKPATQLDAIMTLKAFFDDTKRGDEQPERVESAVFSDYNDLPCRYRAVGFYHMAIHVGLVTEDNIRYVGNDTHAFIWLRQNNICNWTKIDLGGGYFGEGEPEIEQQPFAGDIPKEANKPAQSDRQLPRDINQFSLAPPITSGELSDEDKRNKYKKFELTKALDEIKENKTNANLDELSRFFIYGDYDDKDILQALDVLLISFLSIEDEHRGVNWKSLSTLCSIINKLQDEDNMKSYCQKVQTYIEYSLLFNLAFTEFFGRLKYLTPLKDAGRIENIKKYYKERPLYYGQEESVSALLFRLLSYVEARDMLATYLLNYQSRIIKFACNENLDQRFRSTKEFNNIVEMELNCVDELKDKQYVCKVLQEQIVNDILAKENFDMFMFLGLRALSFIEKNTDENLVQKALLAFDACLSSTVDYRIESSKLINVIFKLVGENYFKERVVQRIQSGEIKDYTFISNFENPDDQKYFSKLAQNKIEELSLSQNNILFDRFLELPYIKVSKNPKIIELLKQECKLFQIKARDAQAVILEILNKEDRNRLIEKLENYRDLLSCLPFIKNIEFQQYLSKIVQARIEDYFEKSDDIDLSLLNSLPDLQPFRGVALKRRIYQQFLKENNLDPSQFKVKKVNMQLLADEHYMLEAAKSKFTREATGGKLDLKQLTKGREDMYKRTGETYRLKTLLRCGKQHGETAGKYEQRSKIKESILNEHGGAVLTIYKYYKHNIAKACGQDCFITDFDIQKHQNK